VVDDAVVSKQPDLALKALQKNAALAGVAGVGVIILTAVLYLAFW
jgi:hypothetical protein